ncbi:MAG: hypothetical protein ABI946_05645 [Chthoniobacterales bacterium]
MWNLRNAERGVRSSEGTPGLGRLKLETPRAMACSNVFCFSWVGALAQGVRDLDAFLRREGAILLDVPAIGLAEAAALFYDSLHGRM